VKLPHFKLKLYICEWTKLILLLQNTPYYVGLSKQKLIRTGKVTTSRDVSYNELVCKKIPLNGMWYQIQSLCLKMLTSFLFFRTKDIKIFWNRKNKIFENAMPSHKKWISLQCCISQCITIFHVTAALVLKLILSIFPIIKGMTSQLLNLCFLNSIPHYSHMYNLVVRTSGLN
jgi:hypothetical protein